MGVGYRNVYGGHHGHHHRRRGAGSRQHCSCSATFWTGDGSLQMDVNVMHQWATPSSAQGSHSPTVITELEVYGDSVCRMSVRTEIGEESFRYRKENPPTRYYTPLPHG